jgi:hypothetical protein
MLTNCQTREMVPSLCEPAAHIASVGPRLAILSTTLVANGRRENGATAVVLAAHITSELTGAPPAGAAFADAKGVTDKARPSGATG